MGFELRNMVNVPPDDGHHGGAPTSILRNVERGPFVSGPHRPGWGADQRDAKHPGTLEKPFSTVSAQLLSAPATGECTGGPRGACWSGEVWCPRWDSNPYWSGFKPPASADWATGAHLRRPVHLVGRPPILVSAEQDPAGWAVSGPVRAQRAGTAEGVGVAPRNRSSVSRGRSLI